jgi:hypothetical protein
MSGWELRIPFRDRSQTPIEALTSGADEALEDPEERRLAARLLLDAATDPEIETIGDLLDQVEHLDADTRRQLLDRTREALGLESATAIESQDHFDALQAQLVRRGAVERDADGRALFICAHPECGAFPVAKNGTHAKLAVRKWWCEEHRHLAAEGDMEPFEFGLRYSRSGALLTDDEVARRAAEAQKVEVENESRRRRCEAEQAERAEEAERLAVYERERDAQLRREMPRGLR